MLCPFCMENNDNGSNVCSSCGKNMHISNEAHQLPVGSILGNRYYVGSVIRQGGFGITYVGCDNRLGKKIAIKEYYPDGYVNRNTDVSHDITVTAGDNTVLFSKEKQRFLFEASILAKFAGEKYIVNVTDIFSENNTVYMIMEFVDGVDLDDYLQTSPRMSFQTAFNMLKPVMDTLSRVHEKGLIHRDISPSNIKVLPDNSPVLLDFGAARQFDMEEEKSYSVILKPGYAPPEQFQTHGVQGPWTDVYAICATLYKMITGVTPENAVDRAITDTLKKPSELGAVISPGEEAVLLKGLNINKDERIRSMPELCEAVRHAAVPAPVQDAYENTVLLPYDDQSKIPAKSKRQKKWLIVIVCVGFLVILLTVFIRWTSGNRDYGDNTEEPTEAVEESTDSNGSQIQEEHTADDNYSPTATLVTGSDVILIGDTTNIKLVSDGMEYTSVEGIRYECDEDIASIDFHEDVQQTLIKGKSEGTTTIRGYMGTEYGETRITVAKIDTASDVEVECDKQAIDIYSDAPEGVNLKVSVKGSLPERVVANAYNSEGLDLNVEGEFIGNVLSINIRDMASRRDDGIYTILFSDADDISHVIGGIMVPVHIYF